VCQHIPTPGLQLAFAYDDDDDEEEEEEVLPYLGGI
jgi:hypothetical protein